MTAWISDDALITLKQILNTINFHEISWRYGERVQGFTHPTWFLFLLPLIDVTHEIFLTTIIVSILLSMLAIVFIYEYTKELVDRTVPVYLLFCLCLLLTFSQAFTDFMTSGLENSLSYCLIGFIVCTSYNLFKKVSAIDVVILYIAFALTILNRLDYIPLLSPLALYMFFKHLGFKKFPALIPGILLLLTWFSFAIVYFGMPFGNTMIAKLGAGYPLKEYVIRGFNYYIVTTYHDPMTMLLIIVGIAVGFTNKNDFAVVNKALSFGMLNYLIYILLSGGDFMVGRFFAVLAYIAIFNLIAALSNYKAHKDQNFFMFTLACVFFILPFSAKPIFSFINYQDYIWDRGVANERGWSYQNYGLMAESRIGWPVLPAKQQDYLKKNDYREICGAAGIGALMYPEIMWIDVCALADPFISQLPGMSDVNWRTGHIVRKIPTNYGEYLLGRVSRIADPQLQPLLDDVRLISKAPIFSSERFKAIWRFNVTRPYEYNYNKYQDPNINIPISTTQREKVYTYNVTINNIPLLNGTAWDLPKVTKIVQNIIIDVQNVKTSGIELSLDCNDVYSITINNNLVYKVQAAVDKAQNGGLVTHTIKFDRPMVVNNITITPVSGDGSYSLGHLLLKDVERSCEHVVR